MKQRITVLFLLMLALCGATRAFAQSESDFTYTTRDGKVTITKYTGRAAAVVIPATIGGLPVTRIGDVAFYGCTGLTAINIPVGVTRISDNAFNGCTGLTGITVDAGNQSYASRDGVLFNKARTILIRYPTGLQGQYTIPAGVTDIGDSAFFYCASLTAINIPASVTRIGRSAFTRCTSLTSVSVPARVTSIEWNAFGGCTALSSVSIPEGVTSIEEGAFGVCTSLTSIIIPASVTSIGEGAFWGCTGLTSISIPEGVTSIGRSAFTRCSV